MGTPEELKDNVYKIKTLIIKAQKLSSTCIEGLRKMYLNVKEIDDGIEIKAKEFNFDEIVDYIRSNGAKIEWFSMEEPSLEDVFLSITGKEMIK
ncbi:MAG: DUF4162 domain-containing protein [Methanobacterium sp. ERen5]|nr:MAG: DUF4162 domain-containing protein [Methanobacterium sp. ERen5]